MKLAAHGFPRPFLLRGRLIPAPTPFKSSFALPSPCLLHRRRCFEDYDATIAGGGDTPAQKTVKAALRARFIALAIAPDFVTDLRQDRDTLDEVHALNRTEDTELIDEQLTVINTEVDILSPIMANIYELQPEKLHAWKRASRVERDPQRAKKESGEDTTTPPAVAA